jgi:hypothetical protein
MLVAFRLRWKPNWYDPFLAELQLASPTDGGLLQQQDARGGANITNANLLIGSIQKLLQDTARHFSHLIPNCEPKIRADLSAMNTFGDLPMGSLGT